MSVQTTTQSVDAHLSLLSNSRRRCALVCLRAHDRPVALPDLADEVAVREHSVPLPDIGEETVLNVYLTLYHTHVPKLVSAGVVEYDQKRDLVSLVDVPPLLDRLLGVVSDTDEGR